jgi:hypothetical protein
MVRLDAALLLAKQDAMAGQFLPDFRTNHRFLRFGDFDLQRLARVGSGHRIEIAAIGDEAILATSAGGEHVVS